MSDWQPPQTKKKGRWLKDTVSEGKPKRDLALERLVTFSDGVFAIAITLLILEIRLPELPANVSEDEVFNQLLALGPKYYSFGISFLIIGIYWLGHHNMFQSIVRCDTILLLLNLLLLMCIAFVPFSLSVMESNYYSRTACVFYALTLAITGLVSAGMWLYASTGGRLLASKLNRPFFRFTLVVSFLSPTLFLLSVPLALWNPFLAHILWLLTIAVGLYAASVKFKPKGFSSTDDEHIQQARIQPQETQEATPELPTQEASIR